MYTDPEPYIWGAPALQQVTAPLLGEQALLLMVLALLGLMAVLTIAMAAVAWRHPASLRMFSEPSFLPALTVAAIVLLTGLLAVERILTGEVSASILSGIAGYVLGSQRQRQTGAQSSNHNNHLGAST